MTGPAKVSTLENKAIIRGVIRDRSQNTLTEGLRCNIEQIWFPGHKLRSSTLDYVSHIQNGCRTVASFKTLRWHGQNIKTMQVTRLLRMASSGMLRRVVLVRTDVSEELSASFIRVTGIGELGTMLAVTSNRRTQYRFLVTASVVPM
jgi:hypothetical protein